MVGSAEEGGNRRGATCFMNAAVGSPPAGNGNPKSMSPAREEDGEGVGEDKDVLCAPAIR
eukprot:1476721-Pyramimonas_sp.AAC.1